MAVKLRLRRMGKKKQPFYRVVATDSRVARNGKYIEKIGHYNPLVNPPDVLIDEEKALMWLNRGAIPTDTVKNLLSDKGIMLKWHLKKKGASETAIEEELKKWELAQIEREKRKEALEAQQKRDETKAETKESEIEKESEVEKEPEVETEAEVEKKTEEAPAEEVKEQEDAETQQESDEKEKE